MNVIFETADGLKCVENIDWIRDRADLPPSIQRYCIKRRAVMAPGGLAALATFLPNRRYDYSGKSPNSELFIYREVLP